MSVVWLTGATIIDGTGADPIENCAVAVEKRAHQCTRWHATHGGGGAGLRWADNHARPHRRTRSSRWIEAISHRACGVRSR